LETAGRAVVSGLGGMDPLMPSTKRPRAKKKPAGPTGSIVATLKKTEMDEAADAESLEFVQAIDAWKRSNGRQFPTWTEVLSIVKELGYQKLS